MKKKHLFLAVLAVILVLSSSIGATLAYFTTYSNARGGYVIHIGNKTEIHETVEGKIKSVQIENTSEDYYPVFVRVKIFAGSDVNVSVDDGQANWAKESDTVIRYTKALLPKELTDKLEIKVNAVKDRTYKAGDTIDVIVVYESVPAVFSSDGSPDFNKAWATGDIHVING